LNDSAAILIENYRLLNLHLHRIHPDNDSLLADM